MIRDKNFTDWDVNDIPVDSIYKNCNFTQRTPDTSGPNPVGIRLFPGDDTPRTFDHCNMVNCEPAPGSILINCNTAINEYGLDAHTEEIVVDTVVVSSHTFKKMRLHGRLNPTTLQYEYYAPVDVGEDY
jgi:hypothetical protein